MTELTGKVVLSSPFFPKRITRCRAHVGVDTGIGHHCARGLPDHRRLPHVPIGYGAPRRLWPLRPGTTHPVCVALLFGAFDGQAMAACPPSPPRIETPDVLANQPSKTTHQTNQSAGLMPVRLEDRPPLVDSALCRPRALAGAAGRREYDLAESSIFASRCGLASAATTRGQSSARRGLA